MFSYVKNQLLAPWSVMRLFRTVIGAAVLVQGWQQSDMWLSVLGGLFATQGLLNVGCCGTESCATGPVKTKAAEEEVEYTEIK
ncbi:MAG: hypothetical protein U0V74_07905 [Chitinophagales bacterium]